MTYKKFLKDINSIWQSKSRKERFWNNVKKSSRCWEYVGHINDKGYGRFKIKYNNVSAHRISYMLLKGEIYQQLDHLCRNPKCVNPRHLEDVSSSINTLRGNSPELSRKRQLLKTHCPHGHKYDKKNTYIRKRKNGKTSRGCRQCNCLIKRN